jgi:hypothetical protein
MVKRHWAVFENQEKNRHLCSRLTIAAQKLYRLLSRKAISGITDAERTCSTSNLRNFDPVSLSRSWSEVKSAQTGVASDERLLIAHRRD